MDPHSLQENASAYLQRFCVDLPHRRVGSQWNLEATDMFAEILGQYGFKVDQQWFDCLDWEEGQVSISCGGLSFLSYVSPYSLACDVRAPLEVVSSLQELRDVPHEACVLLLQGEITKEQLMPKNFPFYNPESHREIIQVLEETKPLAILAATERNPELTGGMYPFPLLEDGDFNIPSVYMSAEEGERLAALQGKPVSVRIESARVSAKGCNVSAKLAGRADERILICAHIDSKGGTPGALDNASGIVTLLLLAELVHNQAEILELEILAINGEDHYSAAGEIEFLRREGDQLHQIQLAINLDSPGYVEGQTAYSLYGCPKPLEARIRETFAKHPDLIEGDPWYQGDHAIFIQKQRPALAITSEKFWTLTQEITHTAEDRIELVDPNKLVELAVALYALLLELQQMRNL